MASVGGQERCTQGCGGGDLAERNNLQDLGVDGRIISKRVCIDLVQDRNKWRAVVNTIMNIRVS